MSSMDRRKFLGVVGAGSAAVTAAAASTAALSAAASPTVAPHPARGPGMLSFRAETGLPGHPWPAYATAVAEGSVDLRTGTGFVATRVLAGPAQQRGRDRAPGHDPAGPYHRSGQQRQPAAPAGPGRGPLHTHRRRERPPGIRARPGRKATPRANRGNPDVPDPHAGPGLMTASRLPGRLAECRGLAGRCRARRRRRRFARGRAGRAWRGCG